MAYGNRRAGRKPFPVSKQPFTGNRPTNSINARGIRPNSGPGLPPPDPRLLRPQPRRSGGPGMSPQQSGVRGRLSNTRNFPNPFRKRGSGGSRRMGTPSTGRILRGKNNY